MTSVNDIRKAFLDFFASHHHQIVSSAPLIPHNDPSLMFVNAGMVPFKEVFTQNETRPYTKAASAQKCVRAGGKHNDLENVGYTARHHTFFEMLGNFSFGDYFKEQAIYLAWQFLTKELALQEQKLWVTIYHEDTEARALWKKIAALPDHKIIPIKTDDNFWSIGNTGPCGPCSEIFYDHGPDIKGGPPGSATEDGDRFIEIWNLVFMQYEQKDLQNRITLPAPSIDTGMGLERMAAVLQGVHDNYHIDLFQALIQKSKQLTSCPASQETETSHRVIADHIRSCSFLIADGITPANEGRGYVLRRIMRRAMRHAYQLGHKEAILHKLVPTLIKEMGEAYPELIRAQNLIEGTLQQEENNFKKTLERGLKLLHSETQTLPKYTRLNGDIAFKLYDTYGFPLDLTMDILRNNHLEVDIEGFNQAMHAQKQRARQAWKGSGEHKTTELWFDIKERHGATEFLGYNTPKSQATILAIIKEGQEITQCSGSDKEILIILNQTPFYGESGGQQGDTGKIYNKNGTATITHTEKILDDIIIHHATLTEGSLKTGDSITAIIDETRRACLKRAHSATHLLHAILRSTLGKHVTQKGSLVAEDRLRFDISHPKPLSNEEITRIENNINTIILTNAPVHTATMAPEHAIEQGALALFGEKYGDEVRVVTMGSHSTELCGGTHVMHAGEIGSFKIISEEAVAAGIRRIEALTGMAALHYSQNLTATLHHLASTMKTGITELPERLSALLTENKDLRKSVTEQHKKNLLETVNRLNIEKIGHWNFIAHHFSDTAGQYLRDSANHLLQKHTSAIVVLTSEHQNKANVLIALSKELTPSLHAVELIKQVTTLIGAKGAGGRAEFAQTGGSETTRLAQVIETIHTLVTAAQKNSES